MTDQVITAKDPRPGALSVPQMLHLMRLEVENANSHDYPVCCLLIALDRYQAPEEREARQAFWWYLLIAAFLLLIAETTLSNRLAVART